MKFPYITSSQVGHGRVDLVLDDSLIVEVRVSTE